MEITIRNRVVESIPVLELFKRDEGEKKPIILLYHGYMGRKEFILPQAYHLAVSGFYVVVPDAYGHGERSGERVVDLFESITKSAEEINMLINSYEDNPNADYKRVGLSGYSMGGCITFLYLAMGDKHIKAAVPVISTPEWVSIVDGFNTREKLEELKGLGIISQDDDLTEYRKLAERIQPIRSYEAMKDVPLLMLCGAKDTVTPAGGAQRLYELLKPVFFDENALKITIYPGAVHGDTVEMNFELLHWMIRFVV